MAFSPTPAAFSISEYAVLVGAVGLAVAAGITALASRSSAPTDIWELIVTAPGP